jgi:hypothetical protein
MENQVIMSLADYSAMLLENTRLKGAIVLSKNSYDEKLQVTIDIPKLYPTLKEKLAQSPFASTHVLRPADRIYDPNFDVAEPIEPEITEGTGEPAVTEE